MPSRKNAVISITTLLLAVIPAAPAAAAPDSQITDPDDMTSRLDVRRLMYIDEGGGVGTLKMKTDDGWSCSYLKLGVTTVRWLFDGAADGDVDLIGNLRCRSGRLWLFLRGTDSGNNYEPAPATHPTKSSARVTMSFDLPELAGDNLAVKVKVKDTVAEGCTKASPCRDRAPDAGRWAVY